MQIHSRYPVSLRGMYDFFQLNQVTNAGALEQMAQSRAQVQAAIDDVLQVAYDQGGRAVQIKRNMLDVSA